MRARCMGWGLVIASIGFSVAASPILVHADEGRPMGTRILRLPGVGEMRRFDWNINGLRLVGERGSLRAGRPLEVPTWARHSGPPFRRSPEQVRGVASQLGAFSITSPPERVLARREGRVVAAWSVGVEGASTQERAALILADADLSLLAAHARTFDARGRVYEPNVVRAPSPVEVELVGLVSSTALDGETVRVRSCAPSGGGCNLVRRAAPDVAGDYLFTPDDASFVDPFAEVSAYAHGSRMFGYFAERFDYVWECCGDPIALDITTNYAVRSGEGLDNAFYTATECAPRRCGEVSLGQGLTRDFAYDADIVRHEIVHALVDDLTANVGYSFDEEGAGFEPAAVNEALADYFSSTVGGDPEVAESLAGIGEVPDPRALRVVDGSITCPEGLTGEPHDDGRVLAGVLWLIRESLGASKADALAYALLGTLPPAPTLASSAPLLIDAAEAMGAAGELSAAEVEVVRARIDAASLGDCRRRVTLYSGVERAVFGGAPIPSGLRRGVAPLALVVELPDDARALRLNITPRGGTRNAELHLRSGAPVGVPEAPAPITSDLVIDLIGGEIALGEGGTHALPGCGPLFLAIRTEDLFDRGSLYYDVRVEIDGGGPSRGCAAPDAGVDAGRDADASGFSDASADAGGPPAEEDCNCRVGPTGAPSSGALLWSIAVLALVVRRARTRPRVCVRRCGSGR